MQKSLVRKRLINERMSLSADDAASKSSVIAKRIIDSALFKDAANIALYSAFRGEVKVEPVFETALDQGKRVLMPRVKREDYTIAFFPVSSPDELEEGVEGFLEPSAGAAAAFDVAGIDLFILPGVAYDLSGTRLGMGKGCYDRALEGIDKERILAPAYELQLIEDVPGYHHDLTVGWIATEDRFIKTVNDNNIEED